MKFFRASVAVFFAVFGSVGFGYSPDIEITPERPQSFKKVRIESKRLDNGDVEFAVSIAHKNKPSPVYYETSLGAMRITQGTTTTKIGYEFRRKIDADTNEVEVNTLFSVTQKELEDPDLVFSLTHGNGDPNAWSFVHYFIRLKKFLSP